MFRHRAFSDARRKLPRKLDLSHIDDPLLALAHSYSPEEAASPLSPTGSTSGFDIADGKPPMLRTRSSTPPLEEDEGSDDEMIDELDETSCESNLSLHARVYALAEKYEIPALKDLAKNKFEMEMACYFDSPDLADIIEEVYCSTIDSDRGLRDVILDAFSKHPQLASTQDIHDVIDRTPSLKCDLFKLEHGVPMRKIDDTSII
jgi:hypothetical protein